MEIRFPPVGKGVLNSENGKTRINSNQIGSKKL